MDHSCWHNGHRLFCFTHNDMQQWWNEWLHSPHTTTQSCRPNVSFLHSAWQRRHASGMKEIKLSSDIWWIVYVTLVSNHPLIHLLKVWHHNEQSQLNEKKFRKIKTVHTSYSLMKHSHMNRQITGYGSMLQVKYIEAGVGWRKFYKVA